MATKAETTKTTPTTIEVRVTESYSTWVVRESMEINVADYPELEGMTEEEMSDYITSNASDMKSSNEEWYDSLYEELLQMDVTREKITGEETEVVVEGFN